MSPSKVGCIVLVFLVALGLAGGGVGYGLHEVNPARTAERQQAIEEARQAAARSDAFWRAVMPYQVASYAVGVIALPVIGVVGLVGLGLVAWSVAHQRRHLVYPRGGVLPVTVDQVVDGSTLPLAAAGVAGYHAAEHARAANPPMMPAHVGGHFHYAPRQLMGRSSAPPSPTVAAPPETAPAFLPAPAFSAIMGQGFTRSGAILVGLTAQHDPVYTDPRGLLSTAVVGTSGSGKTRSAALLLGQAAALCGARLAIADPHAGNTESLTTLLDPLSRAYWRDPVSTHQDARRLIADVLAEIERRKQGAPAFPLLVAVDEFTALMRSDGDNGPLTLGLETVVNEGRKYQVTAVLSGQSWVAARSGGTPLRDGLASAVLHRVKPATARAVWPDVGRATATLGRGQALFARASDTEPQALAVPLFTTQDAHELARLLPAPPVAYPTPVRTQPPPSAAGVSCTNQDRPAAPAPGVGQKPTEPPAPVQVAPVDATDQSATNVLQFEPRTGGTGGTATTDRAAYIRQLHAQGLSRNAISALVFGHKSSTTMQEIRAALESENAS